MGETKNGTAMEATLGAGNGASLLLRGVKKAFADVKAVDGLDLEVARGECFGLLGPNGAGKTTTIEICEGLTAPDDGTVEVLGLNWRTGAGELRQRIGIQLQETQFPDKLTVEETLRMFRSFFKRGISVDESIATAQLEEKRKGRVGTLSGGQKQRLAMACALVGDPELLFLDEPTTGLDPQARRHLWDLVDELKQAGRTIILTTHYMDEAERLCDQLAIVDHGQIIAEGTPADLIDRLGGHHVVEFQVDSDAKSNGHDLELWRALPGVESVRDEEDMVCLNVHEPHLTIPALLAAIQQDGRRLEHLSTRQASLEDVFVRLTGRHLREE